ncbi:hypothetical protein LLEC1_02353 [Akanthomyces lecanii]|uniref:polynucleotide adenylyltransferase n=1 Tax=Cordyceps confragosa TaxID=2714763 RepID=A0A179I303_CORDF|nr:hypothetical protein LLEC1_02353 [Akanthomyces lecanii]
MSSYAGKTYAAPGSNHPATGLEGGFQRLDLSNSSAVPSEQRQMGTRIQPIPPTSDEGAGGLRQTGPNRRRPNQAQRRQLNSQLSVPVDTRPTHYSSNRRGPDHRTSHGGQHVPFPRHQHTMSHPFSNADHSRPGPQAQNPWNNGPAFPTSGNLPQHNGSHPGHQPQPRPSSHFEQRPRHHPGMSQGHRRQPLTQEEVIGQSMLLERLCFDTLASSEIDRSAILEKHNFRHRIEAICRHVITEHEWNTNANPDFPPPSVELKCFGSLASGFATKTSDMDLGLLSPLSQLQPDAPGSPIPRLIEKAFLDAGIGARLLSRTRVPIIKLCESPPDSLLKGLLAQREKWEAGLDQDSIDSQDEDERHGDQIVGTKNEQPKHQIEEARDTIDLTSFQVPDEQGQLREFHLRQTSKHNLAGYYGLAKRVLRKAGGRDITLSNMREFSPSDWTVLNLVCQAFVHGLADTHLRKSLSKYPSLAFELDSRFPHNRSLLGVSIQVEGEQIMHLWQDWSVAADLVRIDPSIEDTIDLWYKLQREQNFGQDPVWYTKELQLALERLKKLPSFQLLLLEQSQQESVAQYYQRTSAITKHLKVSFQDIPDRLDLESINKYIAGICYDDVRRDTRSWWSNTDIGDLAVVSQKHKCLHLAGELERALNKQLYDDVVAEDVVRYIELLRRPPQQGTAPPPNGEKSQFIIPIHDEDTLLLVAKMKTLPDPHKMAPNQPRDRYRDPLEFPKDGAGVQCDINFAAQLALENTALLRCYSWTDPRVRRMVLFIKHWAKVRGINSGYRGTLSSYGYVLMVLHYLVNVATPFVCPNLQLVGPPEEPMICRGYSVKFWRDELVIRQLGDNNQINQNGQTTGYLLRGFFEYFAQNGPLSSVPGRGFDWGRDVLSLRSPGGLLSKQEKGWTGARTVYQAQDPDETLKKSPVAATDGSQAGTALELTGAAPKSAAVKEIRLRYLFAIEDPFELDHNVARTVTHNGIVSIRDEFRRAWRIIQAAGQGLAHDDLLQDVNQAEGVNQLVQIIDEIHGLDFPNA